MKPKIADHDHTHERPPVPTSVVVVGAGLAGGRAVESLRRHGYDGRITLVGDEPEHPYERPPLSKDVLLGTKDPADLHLRTDAWYHEHDVQLQLGSAAAELDLQDRTVTTHDGTAIDFDACLIATGGRPRRIAVPGSQLAGVYYLRTLADATRLRTELLASPRMVVIGAGFIGAEVASCARRLGCEVTVLEALELPLVRALPDEIARVCARLHADHGTTLRLAEPVERLLGTRRVEAVVSASGQTYPADVVVVGVGIEPAQELAAQAGVTCEDGIVTDEQLRTSAAGIWAAGDVARAPNPYLGGHARVEHFSSAQAHGAVAAASMLGLPAPEAEVPWFWSDQYDVNIQTLGAPRAGDQTVMRGDPAGGSFLCVTLRSGALAGAVAFNRGPDVSVLRRMMQRGIRPDPAKLADPDVALRELLRV